VLQTPTMLQTALQKIENNEPSCQRVNLASNGVFSGNSTITCSSIAKALETNTHLLELRLESCNILDAGAAILAEALKKNSTLQLLDLSKNKIGSQGLIALADGLKVNKVLVELVLFSQSQKFGEPALAAVIEMFEYNTTLLNINWRLDSRQSFKINACLTRNKEILRRIKSGLSVDDVLPMRLRDNYIPPTLPSSSSSSSSSLSSLLLTSSTSDESKELTEEEHQSNANDHEEELDSQAHYLSTNNDISAQIERNDESPHNNDESPHNNDESHHNATPNQDIPKQELNEEDDADLKNDSQKSEVEKRSFLDLQREKEFEIEKKKEKEREEINRLRLASLETFRAEQEEKKKKEEDERNKKTSASTSFINSRSWKGQSV